MQQLIQNSQVNSQAFTWLPPKQQARELGVKNDYNPPISENGYLTRQDVVNLLLKYRNNPDAIEYIALMMEE